METTTVAPIDEEREASSPQLADWLRRLREGVGLSQTEAAQAIGAEPRSLRRWENEGNVPSGVMLLRMLSAYGVRLSHDPPELEPGAINAELANIHMALEEIRASLVLLGGPGLARTQLVLSLVSQEAPLTPAARALLREVAARERDAAQAMLEQAELLEQRLS